MPNAPSYTCYMKDRTRTVVQINLFPSRLTESYLSPIKTGIKGVYTGKSIVTNDNNTCIFAINASNKDAHISITPCKIYPFSYDYTSDSSLDNLE